MKREKKINETETRRTQNHFSFVVWLVFLRHSSLSVASRVYNRKIPLIWNAKPCYFARLLFFNSFSSSHREKTNHQRMETEWKSKKKIRKESEEKNDGLAFKRNHNLLLQNLTLLIEWNSNHKFSWTPWIRCVIWSSVQVLLKSHSLFHPTHLSLYQRLG